MNSLQKAQDIAESYQRKESESCVVYAFLGKVINVNEVYVDVDGDLIQYDWFFEMDYSIDSELCYIGRGKTHSRLCDTNGRKINPPLENRVIIADHLSKPQSMNLERELILTLGSAINKNGCLVNIHGCEPAICSQLRLLKTKQNQEKACEAVRRQLVVFDFDKHIRARGTAHELSMLFNIDPSNFKKAASRNNQRTVGIPSSKERLFVCYEEDYPDYQTTEITKRTPCAESKVFLATHKQTGEQHTGTASQLKVLCKLPKSGIIHTIVNPSYPVKTSRGWTFTEVSKEPASPHY